MPNTNKPTITLLYFASLGEKLQCSEESLELEIAVRQLSDLRKCLAQRGEAWQALVTDNSILCAQNQEIVNTDAEIHDRDEIAFFPPVTGG